MSTLQDSASRTFQSIVPFTYVWAFDCTVLYQKTLAFFPLADIGVYLYHQMRSIKLCENKQSCKGTRNALSWCLVKSSEWIVQFDPFFFPKPSLTLSAFSTTPLLLCHNWSWHLCALFWAKLRSSLRHVQQHPWSSKRRDPDVEEEEEESFISSRQKKSHTLLYINTCNLWEGVRVAKLLSTDALSISTLPNVTLAAQWKCPILLLLPAHSPGFWSISGAQTTNPSAPSSVPYKLGPKFATRPPWNPKTLDL